MFKLKVMLYKFVIVSALVIGGSIGGVGIAAAQDTLEPATPTPDVIFITETPVSTEVVIIPPPLDTAMPTAEATVEPTPAPDPVPAPFDINIILPYVGAALVVAILGIVGVAGAGLLLLFRSHPAAQFITKTIGPPLGDAGVTAYEEYAKLTPATFDDDLAKQLRTEWEAFKVKLLSDVKAQTANQVQNEVQKQLPTAVSNAVSDAAVGTLPRG